MQLWLLLMRGNGVGLVNFRVEPCSRRTRGRVLGSCNDDSDAEFGVLRCLERWKLWAGRGFAGSKKLVFPA